MKRCEFLNFGRWSDSVYFKVFHVPRKKCSNFFRRPNGRRFFQKLLQKSMFSDPFIELPAAGGKIWHLLTLVNENLLFWKVIQSQILESRTYKKWFL